MLIEIIMNLQIPNHLAVIIDGNRRWARARGKPPWFGHRAGAKKLEDFLNWCLETGVKQVSIYTLSTENIAKRPKKEIEEIFKILEEYVRKLSNEKFSLLEKYEVRVRFVGELNKLPKPLLKLMRELMKKTIKHSKRILNFLVAYGGHSELTHAVKKIVKKAIELGKVEIREKDIENALWINEPVDLVIRTGGYNRLSNLLLWQSAYAEIYTTKTLWPDFSKKEFIKALKWYSSISRNFGR